mgnify:FL=1
MKTWLAYLCLGLSMTLVGSYVALSKPLVAAFPVMLLAWLRFGTATVLMANWLKPEPNAQPLSSQLHGLLFLESFLGNFLFSICMLYGVSQTSATSAGVIMAAIPAVVAIMSALFLRERLTTRAMLAIGCAFVGIGLYANNRHADTDMAYPNAAWGNTLVFLAVCCEAAYAVIGKHLTAHMSPKQIAATINVWGLVLTTPFGVYLAWQFDFASVTFASWGLLTFYATAASVITVWLWMTGLKHIHAHQAGVFTVFLPISAATIGVLFFNETMTPLQILAFAIALLGVLLATTAKRTTNPLAP